MSDVSPVPAPVIGGNGGLLASPSLITSDLKMISRAIRNGWDVPKEAKREVVDAMRKIVTTATIPAFDNKGNVIELSNARNQTVAARVMVQADTVDQADYWNQDKNDRLDAGKATEIHQFQRPPAQLLPLPPHLIVTPLPPPKAETDEEP